MEPYFVFVIVLLFIINLVSFYFIFKFAKIILSFEDIVEESLEKLDVSHENIHKILKTPLFFDSKEVKIVIKEIEESRNTILEIANTIGNVRNVRVIEELPQEEDIDKPINNDIINQLFTRNYKNNIK